MFYLFIFILGAIIGSFLNVVILRLHNGEKITGRSRCPYCRQQLATPDLIPIFSFIFQGGRCRYCQKKISWQYPLVELMTGAFFVLATYNIFGPLSPLLIFYNFHLLLYWLRNLIFICFLIIIFVYDLRWYLILDRITIPAMVLALVINLWLGLVWTNLFFGVLVGLGFFLLQFLVSSGKWIGAGDLRLGLLMGLMLGWPAVLVALFFAYIIGAIFSLGLLALGKKGLKSQVPFGTFLSLGTIIALFWGDEIVNWYLGLL